MTLLLLSLMLIPYPKLKLTPMLVLTPTPLLTLIPTPTIPRGKGLPAMHCMNRLSKNQDRTFKAEWSFQSYALSTNTPLAGLCLPAGGLYKSRIGTVTAGCLLFCAYRNREISSKRLDARPPPGGGKQAEKEKWICHRSQHAHKPL